MPYHICFSVRYTWAELNHTCFFLLDTRELSQITPDFLLHTRERSQITPVFLLDTRELSQITSVFLLEARELSQITSVFLLKKPETWRVKQFGLSDSLCPNTRQVSESNIGRDTVYFKGFLILSSPFVRMGHTINQASPVPCQVSKPSL